MRISVPTGSISIEKYSTCITHILMMRLHLLWCVLTNNCDFSEPATALVESSFSFPQWHCTKHIYGDILYNHLYRCIWGTIEAKYELLWIRFQLSVSSSTCKKIDIWSHSEDAKIELTSKFHDGVSFLLNISIVSSSLGKGLEWSPCWIWFSYYYLHKAFHKTNRKTEIAIFNCFLHSPLSSVT